MNGPDTSGRGGLIARVAQIEKHIWQPVVTDLERRELFLEREQLWTRYYAELPVVPFARCPHCGEVATQPMDLLGLDGWWWVRDSRGTEPSACPHLLTLLGALHFHGREPREAAPDPHDVILSGPEVPYVVPRLLERPGAVCVIASCPVADRYTAFFMAYFCQPPAPPDAGHQPWLRGQFAWVGDDGLERWDVGNDSWDFDVAGWLVRAPGAIAWIEQGDRSLTLRRAPDHTCPYVNLEGRRTPLAVSEGRVLERPLPDDTPIVYDDLFNP